MRAPSILRRFARDQRGISAIEFALIAPILITIYLAGVQLSLGLTADRKVTSAASAIGDLIAQDDQVTDGEIDDVLAAGDAILQPFDPANFDVRITSVRMDSDGDVFVDWSEGRGLPAHGPDAGLNLPAGLLAPTNSFIFVEVEYAYHTPFDSLEVGTFNLEDSVYLRPRRSLWVRRG